jgi:hypothetical protein
MAVGATFLLVALVVGSLEFGVVWGVAGMLDLPPSALGGGLLAAAAIALVLGAKVARRSWLAERRELDLARAGAEDAAPAA